jgi:hypothetical protein
MKRRAAIARRRWDEADIGAMADRVMAGEVVTTDLNDDSFVMLMTELRRRGFEMAVRGKAEQYLNPFLFRVTR